MVSSNASSYFFNRKFEDLFHHHGEVQCTLVNLREEPNNLPPVYGLEGI